MLALTALGAAVALLSTTPLPVSALPSLPNTHVGTSIPIIQRRAPGIHARSTDQIRAALRREADALIVKYKAKGFEKRLERLEKRGSTASEPLTGKSFFLLQTLWCAWGEGLGKADGWVGFLPLWLGVW